MNGRPTLEELIEVRGQLNLPDAALVEKDWFVVRALAAIAGADKGPFELVFQGGTALSRAHRVIQRMSEDLDLKIIAKKKPSRGELSRLRKSLSKAFVDAGFDYDPENRSQRETMYEGSYTAYRLPYKPFTEGRGVLRPELLIETSVFPMRLPPVNCSVISFVAEALGRPAEVPAIATAAITETAAEKFVALTRRAGSELAGLRQQRDATLVRHVYDHYAIREHYDPAEVARLARDIMHVEAQTRAGNFPAYRDDPLGETLRAVDGLMASADYKASYADLLNNMVYGNAAPFEVAVGALENLAKRLK